MSAESISKNTQLSYLSALKSGFLLIFLATVSYRISDQFLTAQIEGLVKSREGISSLIWLWGGLSLLVAIIFPTIAAIISIYALRYNSVRHLSTFLKSKFELSILETLRAWGYSFLWGLLFIIPGLIKMSFYYLTLFVVLLLPEYEQGNIDALEKSTEISKTHWGKLNLMVVIFYFLIPSAVSILFDEYVIFAKHPVTALFFAALESAAVLLFHYIVFNMFINYFLPPQTVSTLHPLSGDAHVTHV